MDKKTVISFFDSLAEGWDREAPPPRQTVLKILGKGGVVPGCSLLDVACGTGVLFPYYEELGVAELTAVDISEQMVKKAREKYPKTDIICADAEVYDFKRKFDVIMIHNAFPHFPEPQGLIENLTGFLKRGGRLSIAHSMSREQLNLHHSQRAEQVSFELPEVSEVAHMLEQYLEVDVVLSDESMYQVSGILVADRKKY